MILPKTKTSYREVIGVLAFFSALEAADCYFSHGFNAYYFPKQSHQEYYILAIIFAALFVGFMFELFSLYIFKRRAKKQNEKSA